MGAMGVEGHGGRVERGGRSGASKHGDILGSPRGVRKYMAKVLSKCSRYHTYISRHRFTLSWFSSTELRHIVCELSRYILSCLSMLTCFMGHKI